MKIINTYIPKANVPGQIWQGYVPSPYDTDEFLIKVDHQLNQAHRLSASLLLDERQQHRAAGTGNLPWAVAGVQVDAAQPERERHLGDERQPDQPGVVLVQPQLRRPQQPAGDLAHRPRLVRDHHGRPVAAADHGERLLHAVQRDRRPDGGRRLLLGARRVQLDDRQARDQAGRRDLLQQDRSRTRCSTTTASSRSTTASRRTRSPTS